MNRTSISQLYQSLTAPQTLSARAMVDADTAVRAASGRVVPHERQELAAVLAGSSAHADLVQFLRALEPASAELAHGLAQGAAVHESRDRSGRVAHGRRQRERGWQGGAIAACLIAAFALFVARQDNQSTIAEAKLAQQAVPAAVDTIFDASMEPQIALHSGGGGDVIFRDNVMDDHVFRSRIDG